MSAPETPLEPYGGDSVSGEPFFDRSIGAYRDLMTGEVWLPGERTPPRDEIALPIGSEVKSDPVPHLAPNRRPVALPTLRGPLLSPEAKRAALVVAGELGVTYGLPVGRLLVQLLVDMDAAAQAVASWAKAAGGTTGGVVRSIENAGGGLASSVALGKAYEQAVAARSPAYGDLMAIDSILRQVRGVDVGGWVV